MNLFLRNVFVCLICLTFFMGCRTVNPPVVAKDQGETMEDVDQAIEAIAGAVIGKKLSEEEYKDFKKEIRKNPEAQSAIEVITQNVSGQQRCIKYSPQTGKRYACTLDIDPETGVKLEILDP